MAGMNAQVFDDLVAEAGADLTRVRNSLSRPGDAATEIRAN